MDELTPRQRQVLHAIVRYWQTQGRPPTVRELMEPCKCRHPNAMSEFITILREKGYLEVVTDGSSRSIRPVGLQVLAVVGRDEAGNRLRSALFPSQSIDVAR